MRRVLAVLLLVWEPLTSAYAASGLITRFGTRPLVAVLLVLRVLVVAAGIAAGMSLWQDRPGGIVLARWAIALSLAAAVATSLSRAWPGAMPPELAGPALAALVVWNLGWLAWTLRQPS